MVKFDPVALVARLLKPLNEREKDIIYRRFRLGGQARRETLGSIGKSMGLTRERIRQIGTQAIRKMKKTPGFREIVRPADKLILKVLGAHGGIMEKNYCLARILASLGKGGLSEREKTVQQAHIFFIVSVLDRILEEVKISGTRSAWKLKGAILDFPRQALKELLEIFKKTGHPLKLVEIIELLKKRPSFRRGEVFSRDVVRSFLEWSDRIDKNPYDEWGLTSWRTIRPKRVGDKAYLVLKKAAKPLHFTEIARLINEHFEGRRAHVPAVHNELIINDNFVLIGRGLYALREWGYVPGTVADIVLRVLKKARPLSRRQIINEVLKQRMVRSTTISLALTDEKKFKKLPSGEYTLR